MLISEWSSDVFSSDLKGSTMRDAFKWAHIQFGIAIILTMIPRLVACLHGQHPHIVPPPPSWQKWLAHLVQFVLYVLLFAVPLLGIANRLWSPSDWNFLGIALPHVPATDRSEEHTSELQSLMRNSY